MRSRYGESAKGAWCAGRACLLLFSVVARFALRECVVDSNAQLPVRVLPAGSSPSNVSVVVMTLFLCQLVVSNPQKRGRRRCGAVSGEVLIKRAGRLTHR